MRKNVLLVIGGFLVAGLYSAMPQTNAANNDEQEIRALEERFAAFRAKDVPGITSPQNVGEPSEHPAITFIKSKVKDAEKPFAVIVEGKVKAGKEQAFQAAVALCARATRQEPGCTAYYLNRDSERPGVYVMYEQWKNIAPCDKHTKTQHFLTMARTMEPLVDGEMSMRVLLVPE